MDVDIKQTLSTVLEFLLTIAVPWLLIQVRPLLQAKIKEASSKMSAQELQLIRLAASIGVNAAQQFGGANGEKFQVALGYATEYLKSVGISFEEDALVHVIESEVARMKAGI